MKIGFVLFMTMLCLSFPGFADDAKTIPGDSPAERVARTFVTMLCQGDFQKATADFDEKMKVAATSQALEAMWKGQQSSMGAFQKVEAVRIEAVKGFQTVFLTCQFQKHTIDMKLAIGKDDKIAGMFFVPTMEPSRIPGYAKKDLFQEKEVSIGLGDWVLPGMLSIPTGKGPFPAIVLVHGSGPQDMDETIGPNKPFRDLAWGLASRGIAVLRFEKRTHKYGLKIKNMTDLTVKEETIADALEAVSLLQKTEGIDAKRVFVLGHSLGGMVAPRIAQGGSGIAGLVILAGAARPLEDLILEQVTFQASLAGNLPPDAQKKLDQIKGEIEAIKKLTKDSSVKGMLFNAPAVYWLDLKGYNPAEMAKKLKQPMLLLQGEKDCQVQMADFAEWKKALSDRSDVVLKTYPTLNHLFMEVQGKSTGAEYQQAGNVTEAVIIDIADWIGKH